MMKLLSVVAHLYYRLFVGWIITRACVMACCTEGPINRGTVTLQSVSTESKLNVTVVYERCFTQKALYVDAMVNVPSAPHMKFSISVLGIKLLSFEAELARVDSATGWNLTDMDITWKTYHDLDTIKTGVAEFTLASSTPRRNVTITFENSSAIRPLYVETRIRKNNSAYLSFDVYTASISCTSFVVEIRRRDGMGWANTTFVIEWKSYQFTAAFNQTNDGKSFNIYYYRLPSAGLTWQTARDHCLSVANRDLCDSSQICHDGGVRLTGTTFGADWSPIREETNNWLQIGDEQGGLYFCREYFEAFHVEPEWSKEVPGCQYSTPYNVCYPRGHVFCCSPVN